MKLAELERQLTMAMDAPSIILDAPGPTDGRLGLSPVPVGRSLLDELESPVLGSPAAGCAGGHAEGASLTEELEPEPLSEEEVQRQQKQAGLVQMMAAVRAAAARERARSAEQEEMGWGELKELLDAVPLPSFASSPDE